MTTDNPSYYAIIPANVRYDKSLPANAKLMYGEITALCGKEGFCWAGNKYFADLYGVSTGTISRWVTVLSRTGYIRVDIIRDKTGQIIKRTMRLAAENDGGMHKNEHTYTQKSQNPIPKKRKENITSNNTTSIMSHKNATHPDYKKIMDYFTKIHGSNFANYAKEGKALNSLLSLNDNDSDKLRPKVLAFRKLTKSDDKYFRKQPFSPSRMLACYDDVMKYIGSQVDEEDMLREKYGEAK